MTANLLPRNMKLLLYVGLGIFADFLVTCHYISILRKLGLLASALSMAITILSFLVIEQVVISRDFSLIVAYGLGNSIGTFAAMKMRKN
jgi:hypothetical protein